MTFAAMALSAWSKAMFTVKLRSKIASSRASRASASIKLNRENKTQRRAHALARYKTSKIVNFKNYPYTSTVFSSKKYTHIYRYRIYTLRMKKKYLHH